VNPVPKLEEEEEEETGYIVLQIKGNNSSLK
jgi:hypothetical protein